MSAKHFINNPDQAVIASLHSLTLTNPSILFDEPNKIVYRHPASIGSAEEKISVVSGGGSGHEPGFAGYVGRGLLTACVAGTIFASPGAEQIRTCLLHRLPQQSKGILVIATNYTGDVLNFGMGVEKARAMGKMVEMVIVGDDVGVGRKRGGKVGRRGLTAAAVANKVCGALAEMGVSLEDTARTGRLVVENAVSIAVSLGRVHVPGHPVNESMEEADRLPMGVSELGMGIHNEPGCEKLQTDLPDTVKKMLSQLLDQDDKDRAYLKISRADKVALFINNFGGLSNLELGAVTTEIWGQLGKTYGLIPVRIISGVLFGSLDGQGFGITLLRLEETKLGEGKSMLNLIDYPTEAVGWPARISTETWENKYDAIEQKTDRDKNDVIQSSNLKVDPSNFQRALNLGLERVIAAEADVTRFDSIVGDGDCGIGLKRGAEAIQQIFKEIEPTDDLLFNFSNIIRAVERSMDGTSGALYAIFLNTLAHKLRLLDTPKPTQITPQIWAKALESSLQALGKYTPAQPGDRTLIDALYPFIETLKKTADPTQAATAAKYGAQSTKGMEASLGRSVYVGGEGWREVPDPGAHGLSVFLTGLVNGL